MEEFITDLIKPLLLAYGFQPKTIADYINEE